MNEADKAAAFFLSLCASGLPPEVRIADSAAAVAAPVAVPLRLPGGIDADSAWLLADAAPDQELAALAAGQARGGVELARFVYLAALALQPHRVVVAGAGDGLAVVWLAAARPLARLLVVDADSRRLVQARRLVGRLALRPNLESVALLLPRAMHRLDEKFDLMVCQTDPRTQAGDLEILAERAAAGAAVIAVGRGAGSASRVLAHLRSSPRIADAITLSIGPGLVLARAA